MSAPATTAVEGQEGTNENIKISIKLPTLAHSHHHHAKKSNNKKNELLFQFNKDAKVETIINVLAFTEQTKYLTNIQLRWNDKILNEEDTIFDVINGKVSDMVHLSIEVKPYTARDSLKHLLTVRDFIGFASETSDGLSEFAVSTGSKFTELPLGEIRVPTAEEEEQKDEAAEDKEVKKNVFKVSDEEKDNFAKVVHEIFESSKKTTINQVLTADSNVVTPCVRSLTLSAYNPVPVFYKSRGHLFYLQVVTLEGETFHVTATQSGFYINKSTSTKFDPSERLSEEHNNESKIFYSLYDLLASHSKKFVSHVETFEKKLAGMESVSYVKPVSTFLHKPWLVTPPTNPPDYFRLQLDSQNVSVETNFNDQFQAIRDLPTNSLMERIEFERLQTKIIHEFSVEAIKGAMSIFNDNLPPLNPESPTNEQIFLSGHIFYSFVTSIKDNGINEDAARAISNHDLKTINLLNRVNLNDVRYVLTTIVDFAGRRLLAQNPVPGLLDSMGTQVEKDPETGEETLKDLNNDVMVKYGLDEEEGKILFDADFDAALGKEFAKIFHLKKHQVSNGKDGENVDIWFSSKSRGIVGFDKRKYILDLANTYPLDINFVRENYDNVADTKRYPHRQTLMRPELVEKWWNAQVEKNKDLTMDAAYDGNMFSYNPDAFVVDGVEDPTVEEISTYLTKEVLPGVVADYIQNNVNIPYNGEHLVDTLHKNGINLRYLGKFIELVQTELSKQVAQHTEKLKTVAEGNIEYENWEKEYLVKIEKLIAERQAKINKLIQEGKEVPKELTEDLKLNDDEIRKPTDEQPIVVAKDELTTLINIAELEIITRSLKHVLRSYSKDLPVLMVPSLIAFVLNLLFGEKYNDSPVAEEIDNFHPIKSFSFHKLTRTTLLEAISKESYLRFRYELPTDWISKYSESPFIAIRSLSYKIGIQLVNKQYFFTTESFETFKQSQDKKIRNKLVAPLNTFSVKDLTIIPRVKTSEFSSLVGQDFWTQGTLTIQEAPKDALTLFAQAITVMEEVSSILHPSVAEKYLSVSTVYNQLGLTSEAVAFCRKACKIYERVCGVDSFEMLRALTNLAMLETSNKSPYNAAVVYKRIIETLQSFNLSTLHHPSMTSIYSNIEQLSLGVENIKLSMAVLKHLCDLIVSFEGKESLAYAFTESRLGNLYVTVKDFRSALQHIAVTEPIFSKELGTNHVTTAQSRQWINGLTNVVNDMQKQLNQTQAAVNAKSNAPAKKHKNKKDEPNAELADKSVDELLNFIEGDQKSSGSSKGKKGKKGGKHGKK